MTHQKYDALKFRIHNLPLEVNLFKEFPELDHPELYTKLTNQNKVLRYLIYMFDPKSDLLRDFPQLKDRKEKALILAGYQKLEGKLEPEAEEILSGTNKEITKMAYAMTTLVYHDRKFREWHTLYQELDEYTALRWKPVSADESKDELAAAGKKNELRKFCEAIHDAIDAIEKVIFGDNDDVKNHAVEVMLTSPESVGMAFFNKEEV